MKKKIEVNVGKRFAYISNSLLASYCIQVGKYIAERGVYISIFDSSIVYYNVSECGQIYISFLLSLRVIIGIPISTLFKFEEERYTHRYYIYVSFYRATHCRPEDEKNCVYAMVEIAFVALCYLYVAAALRKKNVFHENYLSRKKAIYNGKVMGSILMNINEPLN